ncbi:uncharacterized protein LOC124594224 [Schistocerca americana]|uniref:uncharacterized protein LOC124594224 n=1 Tax=Schistocerca americana TaxID=7009 RepID=UPI001F4F78EC|nr:uncharacterized protein LOC124594224 [Schistocerca americana]
MELCSHKLENIVISMSEPVVLHQDPTSEQTTGNAERQKNDTKVGSLIVSVLSKPDAEFVLTCKYDIDTWDKLCAQIENLNDELTKHEENTLSERKLNGRIISLLGKGYDNFKDLWETIPLENLSMNLHIEKLCTIQLCEQNVMHITAFVVCITWKKKMSKGRTKQNFTCNKSKHICHWAVSFFHSEFDVAEAVSF